MDDDWDLQAVVRGCSAAASTSAAAAATSSSSTCFVVGPSHPPPSRSQPLQDDRFVCFQDLFEPRIDYPIPELQDLYMPFLPASQSRPAAAAAAPLSPPPPHPHQRIPISPLSILGGLQDLSSPPHPPPHHHQVQQQKQLLQGKQPQLGSSRSSVSSQSPRSKRRKNQMKRVCQVPAEGLSSDMWSWRKYGQKPIKGSPYPRGYYRCSTSKGCLARKQVERNRSDPGMFIVTYTAEHNHPMPTHRNSLAGSTRQKAVNPQPVPACDPNKPSSCSPPVSPATSLSPSADKLYGKEDMTGDEDDDFRVSDAVMDDDFFAGLDDFACTDSMDCFSDNLPPSLGLPWLANSATTTAAGGG